MQAIEAELRKTAKGSQKAFNKALLKAPLLGPL